jgi:tripartite-type tricarboxylate transporter receptor subunit TctC
MRPRVLLAALAIALAGAAGAQAETYPSRPITLIAPFPAGGPTDTLARILGDKMKDTLGQTIIIENVSGAGGTIGVNRVMHADPDGYTLLIGNWSSNVRSPVLHPVSGNVLTDLEPISRLAVSKMILVGRESLPANNINELIAWLKAHPNKATAASVGSGSAAHVCGLHFEQQTATKYQFVFYRGGAPAMQDLLAGTIDVMCAEASQTLGHVRAGKMKAFAVMSAERWAPLPNVPTMGEIGVAGMQLDFWHGLWAPKGTPKDVVAKIDAAVVKAFDDPAVKKRIADLGQVIPPKDQLTPEGLRQYEKAETAKWWPIIKAAGIKTQ